MGGGVKALHLIHDDLVIRALKYFLQADLSFVIRVKKKSLTFFLLYFMSTLCQKFCWCDFQMHSPSITLGRNYIKIHFKVGKPRRPGGRKHLTTAEMTPPEYCEIPSWRALFVLLSIMSDHYDICSEKFISSFQIKEGKGLKNQERTEEKNGIHTNCPRNTTLRLQWLQIRQWSPTTEQMQPGDSS